MNDTGEINLTAGLRALVERYDREPCNEFREDMLEACEQYVRDQLATATKPVEGGG